MRRAVLALALLLAACGDDDADVEVPGDATTTSVDLSDPAPLPTVPRTAATTAPPTTVDPATPPPATKAPPTMAPTLAPPATQASVHYSSCAEAREAGAAPVRRGDPGYGSHLDRDGDGVACE